MFSSTEVFFLYHKPPDNDGESLNRLSLIVKLKDNQTSWGFVLD